MGREARRPHEIHPLPADLHVSPDRINIASRCSSPESMKPVGGDREAALVASAGRKINHLFFGWNFTVRAKCMLSDPGRRTGRWRREFEKLVMQTWLVRSSPEPARPEDPTGNLPLTCQLHDQAPRRHATPVASVRLHYFITGRQTITTMRRSESPRSVAQHACSQRAVEPPGLTRGPAIRDTNDDLAPRRCNLQPDWMVPVPVPKRTASEKRRGAALLWISTAGFRRYNALARTCRAGHRRINSAADRERASEEAIHQGATMNSAEPIPSRSTTGPHA